MVMYLGKGVVEGRLRDDVMRELRVDSQPDFNKGRKNIRKTDREGRILHGGERVIRGLFTSGKGRGKTSTKRESTGVWTSKATRTIVLSSRIKGGGRWSMV